MVVLSMVVVVDAFRLATLVMCVMAVVVTVVVAVVVVDTAVLAVAMAVSAAVVETSVFLILHDALFDEENEKHAEDNQRLRTGEMQRLMIGTHLFQGTGHFIHHFRHQMQESYAQKHAAADAIEQRQRRGNPASLQPRSAASRKQRQSEGRQSDDQRAEKQAESQNPLQKTRIHRRRRPSRRRRRRIYQLCFIA